VWSEADEEGRSRELWPVCVPRDRQAGVKTWKKHEGYSARGHRLQRNR
jgi:hypothetical protein